MQQTLYNMLANSLSPLRQYLPVLCLLLTPLALQAQDTLILKPTPKKPQGDTLIVKLARVYFAKEISYVPYENFHLTEKDKKIRADGKMIKRPDQAELDALSVEKILYDEKQKNTIQFIYKNYNKIKRLQELRTVKNIVSVGLSYTSLSTFDLTIDVLGSTKTPSQYVIFLQPTYERLVYRGMLGLRIAPTIGLNRPAFGAVIGHRIYFFKQRPFSFALGTDIAFVNSTLYRQFSVSSNKQMRKENKNELYISPLAVQFSYTFKNNYYIGLDFSFGGRYIFQNKPFIFDGESYKYDDLPFMSQLRLNIGKKF